MNKQLLAAILFCIIYDTRLVGGNHIQAKISRPLDALPCWASSDKLLNMCKTYLTTVQAFTLQQTDGVNDLKKEDNVLAAQVAVDAAFNECQNILNINAALKLALQNTDTPNLLN